MSPRPPAAPAPNLLALDEQLCFPLYSASHLIQRLYRPLLRPLQLTYPQYLVMMVLWEEDGVSVNRLCERLLLDSGTLSPLLNRLEGRGLVRKRADADDGRKVLVGLTAKGRAQKARAARVPEALLCRLLTQKGEGAPVRLVELRAQLKALVQHLDQTLRAEPEINPAA